MSGLVVDASWVRSGDFTLDVGFAVPDDATVAMVGPNGAGKSSTIRVIAGVEPIDSGVIKIGDSVVDDPASGVFVSPRDRRIGVVWQDAALFPHMTALRNVMFGVPDRSAAEARARQWLERIGASSLADRRASTLSGGETQRVALARALASEPSALLLDEPFAALDASARPEIRALLASVLDEFDGPAVVVTHDSEEAILIADSLVVMEAGRVLQSGSLAEVRSRPASEYVSHFVGVNILQGVAESGVITGDGWALTAADMDTSGDVTITIHPSAVGLFSSRPSGSARNTWEARIEWVTTTDNTARIGLGGPLTLVAEVTPAGAAAIEARPGSSVWVAVKASEIHATGRRP